ncbi:unnamed protein product, partial [marine sediment metagenome]
ITIVPEQPLEVDKTGTANTALGFSMIVDEKSLLNEIEVLIMKELNLIGSPSIDKAVYFSDDGGGHYAALNLTTSC